MQVEIRAFQVASIVQQLTSHKKFSSGANSSQLTAASSCSSVFESGPLAGNHTESGRTGYQFYAGVISYICQHFTPFYRYERAYRACCKLLLTTIRDTGAKRTLQTTLRPALHYPAAPPFYCKEASYWCETHLANSLPASIAPSSCPPDTFQRRLLTIPKLHHTFIIASF